METVPAFVVLEQRDGRDWYRPTGHTRGPWDPHACHAGPPTGLLVRAAERLLPEQQLVRITVELTRPIPHAGFAIDARVARAGRTVSTSDLAIVDGDGRVVVTARGMHLATIEAGALGDIATTPYPVPALAAASPGPFPIPSAAHDLPMFSGGVEVRYPPGDGPTPGPTRMWMRTVPLVLGEEPSGFQRICALADCGNAVSRNAEANGLGFMNTDLTVVLQRSPVGEWFGIDSTSRWEPNGIGMSDSLLFDEHGAVGRAVQTLVIRPR
jgi:hypothetical protein